MYCQPFWLGRAGSEPDEYEDRSAADPDLGRFAVADGVSESAYADWWAQVLVEQFVWTCDEESLPWAAWVPAAQQRWLGRFEGREIPYHAEEKFRQGAFATFLGLVVTPDTASGFRWRAVAVGDSCLFQTRGAELLHAFPIRESQAFGNQPWQIGSRMPMERLEPPRAVADKGTCLAGDRLWMMTDALARWFLKEHEADNRPWEQMEPLLESWASPEQFASWIDGLRDSRGLRNDDVTLLVVHLET